ncbi:MAG: hypothetical protein H6898_12380 [Rhodobacter sp.]|nr:hypothetical protein [Paracoccaceae bacterium]MCC0077360.1 hypothetical protein [Rhodobacter sp.]
MTKRDDSLPGGDARRAVDTDLTTAEWYHSDVPRKVMKGLMARSDQRAIRDTILLSGLMAAFAGLGIAHWPSWGSAPFWLAYGVLHGSPPSTRGSTADAGGSMRRVFSRRASSGLATRPAFCFHQ